MALEASLSLKLQLDGNIDEKSLHDQNKTKVPQTTICIYPNNVRPVKPSGFALKCLVIRFCTSNLMPNLKTFFEVEKLGDEAKVEDDSNKKTNIMLSSPFGKSL